MARAIGFEIKKCLLAVAEKEGKKEGENGVKEETKVEKQEIKEEVAGSSSG